MGLLSLILWDRHTAVPAADKGNPTLTAEHEPSYYPEKDSVFTNTPSKLWGSEEGYLTTLANLENTIQERCYDAKAYSASLTSLEPRLCHIKNLSKRSLI